MPGTVPDREWLYEMIYESRFQRLWDQFRCEHEEVLTILSGPERQATEGERERPMATLDRGIV